MIHTNGSIYPRKADADNNGVSNLGSTSNRFKEGYFTNLIRVGTADTTTAHTTIGNVCIDTTGFWYDQVTVGTSYGYFLRGKGKNYAQLYVDILGIADTPGRATLVLGNSTNSAVADSAYGKLILYSYTTKYSSIESSANIAGTHINYLPIYNTGTGTYYGRLVGIYKGTSGGSTSGFSDVGSTTQPVYVTANGVVTSTSHALKATVNNGTEDTISYYSTNTAISSASKITYFSYPYTDTTNGPKGAGSSSGLKITETSQGGAANLKSGNAALVSYGDSGPQIRFASGDTGILLYHHYDAVSDGGDGSFHFLNSTGVATVMAGGFTSYANAANKVGFRLRNKADNSFYGILRITTYGTTSTAGVGELVLGNATASGTAGNAKGVISLYSNTTKYVEIMPSDSTNGNHYNYLPIYNTGTSTYYGKLVGIYKSTTAGSTGFSDVGSSSIGVYITANGVAKATGSSDIRLKNIQNNKFPDVSEISAKKFIWNELYEDNDNKEHIGYIAQDVEKIAPYLVDEDEDGYKRLNYIEFLCAKIQCLEDKIKQLEEKFEK